MRANAELQLLRPRKPAMAAGQGYGVASMPPEKQPKRNMRFNVTTGARLDVDGRRRDMDAERLRRRATPTTGYAA